MSNSAKNLIQWNNKFRMYMQFYKVNKNPVDLKNAKFAKKMVLKYKSKVLTK